MSRRTYPRQLRDHLGNVVQLSAKPFAIGGEGAIFDVVGQPTLVAKLYSKPQSNERCLKLRAMAKLCSPDLLKIAAWPTATLSNGNPAVVEGILMPRIVDHKEIHHLYSVAQRKKDFPEADWAFLLHTARNCAIAFECVHAHGHVVGDVNQKNVMVSKKGIVALVDCDSFQVKEGNRVFRCSVGVPEYTPPELHGRKFTDLDRNANHDLFGLAVMVFHLLMMGRHPFAGVPEVNVDIPIEKAIKDGLYAYARNPSKLKPPPHVPPLEMLDAPTRELFERAFGSYQRPTASDWHHVLDTSMKGLQRCRNDPKHSYPAGNSCPWCQLIAVARLMFFIPSQRVADATLRIENIRNLIQKLLTMQLVLPSYTQPRPQFPVQVTLPASLREIQKPALLPHPIQPTPIPKPALLPLPPVPILLPRPKLLPLPAVPEIPPAPRLKPYPPAPAELPRPKLHEKPPPQVYPPIPTPEPLDPFLARLSIAGVLAGVVVFFIVRPVGVVIMLAYGAAWLLLRVTEGMRREMAFKSLRQVHELECAQIDDEYEKQVKSIEEADLKLLGAWNAEYVARAAEHARLCKAVDLENRSIIAPWEAIKAAIEARHHRLTQEVIHANGRILSDWQAENKARQSTYEQACRKTELENRRLTLAWDALTASRHAEHRLQCDEIDAQNRQIIANWETTNAHWFGEQKRWRDRASIADAEIKRLENELGAQRRIIVSRFQQRKADVQHVLKSHDGAMQDYERELRQAEMDSKKVQLEEHLDKMLIRNASLKGITPGRILSLESFGIETAKDLAILENQKVPGIGNVLSKRLFDWRDKIASSFRPRQGLPESERTRVTTRYAPIFLPLIQILQSAISELESMAASHRAIEAERIKAIAANVQDLAVADAHFRAMKVV